MPQTPKSIQLSDPIINVDWATQNKATSAERVAEQTLSTQKMLANFSPFRIRGVPALHSARPGYIPVLPLISSMILSKLLNFFELHFSY